MKFSFLILFSLISFLCLFFAFPSFVTGALIRYSVSLVPCTHRVNSSVSSGRTVCHPNNIRTQMFSLISSVTSGKTKSKGMKNSTITVQWGDTIEFSLKGNGNFDSHPFQLCLSEGCGNRTRSVGKVIGERDDGQWGITRKGENHRITWNINKRTIDSVVYYGCYSMAYMGGSINLLNVPSSAPLESSTGLIDYSIRNETTLSRKNFTRSISKAPEGFITVELASCSLTSNSPLPRCKSGNLFGFDYFLRFPGSKTISSSFPSSIIVIGTPVYLFLTQDLMGDFFQICSNSSGCYNSSEQTLGILLPAHGNNGNKLGMAKAGDRLVWEPEVKGTFSYGSVNLPGIGGIIQVSAADKINFFMIMMNLNLIMAIGWFSIVFT
jgi:hypothetical protein